MTEAEKNARLFYNIVKSREEKHGSAVKERIRELADSFRGTKGTEFGYKRVACVGGKEVLVDVRDDFNFNEVSIACSQENFKEIAELSVPIEEKMSIVVVEDKLQLRVYVNDRSEDEILRALKTPSFVLCGTPCRWYLWVEDNIKYLCLIGG